jgi:hypothetical protein
LSTILFNLYIEYLTEEAFEGFGDLKIGQVIFTVKCADDLVLLAKDETVLQGMIDGLTEIGRCYGIEKTVEETKAIRISREPYPLQVMIDQKQLENVKHFNYSDSMKRNNARCTREIKSWLALAKAAFNKTKILFTSKSDLHLKQKQANCYIWSIALCGAETWTLRKVAQNTWKVLNCSAGEGRRMSVGPIV